MNYFKPIRSFVRREGRITKAQKEALEKLLPIYGITPEGILDFDKLFGRTAETVLEIGFGMGSSLVEMAEATPEKNFIGIEVHRPGVGAFLQGIRDANLKNVCVITEDATEILKDHIANNNLQSIQIYFPDPWPKKRHHKRRIIQANFVQLLHAKLKSDGILHLATDWQPYAEWMLEIMSAASGFKNLAGEGHFSDRPAYRPETKFEARGKRLGHEVFDLIFVKI